MTSLVTPMVAAIVTVVALLGAVAVTFFSAKAAKRLPPSRRPGRDNSAAGGLPIGGPDGVEVGGRSIRVGDDHAATLIVTGYPAEVGAGWPEPILAYPGRVDVVLHIEPVPPQVAAQRLRTQRGRLESSRRQDAARGRLDDPELDAAAFDAADLATRIARGEVRLFRLGVYLTVHGSSPEELADRVVEVRNLAASMLLDTVPATWRQLQGWITSLPLGFDALAQRRIFDTDALAAAFPFTSPDLPLPPTGAGGGRGAGMEVLYGLNLASSGVVVWNRWAQDNFNAVILARSGAGKSFLAKLDLLRNLYLGVDAFVVDKDNEYVHLAETVGGTVIRPGVPGVRINPLDLHPGDGTDALYRRCMFMQTFLAVLTATRTPATGPAVAGSAGGLSDAEAAALDDAVLAAYRAHGITTDPRTWRRPAPLLADVSATLAAGTDAGRHLALRLRPYVSGSFKTLFDGPTTTPAVGHFVVYAIKDVPEELLPIVTLLTLDAIWRQVSSTPVDQLQLVLVDEAWRLLSSGAGAEFLKQLAKGARKFGAGLSVVTQDAADVLATDIGRAVVSNAATQILLRQAPQAIDAVTDAFALTGGERDFLLSAAPGDALLVCGASRVAFHGLADQTEAELAHTGPAA